MANTVGGFNPSPHPVSPRLARPSLHDMVLEHDGPLPFIWRNLVKWHGGKANPDAAALHRLPNGHDAVLPPHKRRRLSASDSNPAAASTLAMAPERPSRVLKEPPASAAFLSLKLSSVPHRDSRSPTNGAASMYGKIPATCRITLHQGQTLFDRVLHCQSVPCELVITRNSLGASDILCVEPTPSILVPKHALNVVNRRDGTFRLHDSYYVTVDLEAGDGPRWPPLSLQDMGIPHMRDVDECCVLRGSARDLVGEFELPVNLIPNVNAPMSFFPTHFVMKISACWADTPTQVLPSRSLPTPDNTTGSPQRPTTSSAFAESLVDRNLALADDEDDDDDRMDTDGQPTPSRLLRARRTTMVYNLKDLSDKQLGRERRRHSQVPLSTSPRADQVCWMLPTGESVWLDANRCITCRMLYKNFNQLINHLETAHPDLKYDAKVTRQGHTIHIASNFNINLSPTKTLNYVRPAKRIDVQAYREGDESWVSYTYEEAVDEEVRTPRKNRRQSVATPTTKKSKSSPQQLAGQKRRRPVVPYIPDTPLYHPVSKQLLTPGEELPQPAPDKQWLLQKYREALRDFSDITPEEREYMFKWDSFLQPLNVTTAAHLPTIWLAFVDKHADWLVEKEHRMLEFTKHAALLYGRSLIKSSAAVTQRLNTARRLKQDRELQSGAANGTTAAEPDVTPEDDLSRSPRLEHIKKGGNGCVVCKLPVRGPKQLLCTGDDCLRLYHTTCVKDAAKMPITSRRWRCNSCLESSTAS